MKSIMLCFLFILHFLHFPSTYIIRWQERISFVNTLPRRRKIGRIFLGPNIYGSFYSGHFLLELLKSALKSCLNSTKKSFPSSLHHLGLNWIFCLVHFSPVYACYELPCVSWEDRIKGNFPPGLFGAIKEFEAAPRPPGGCPEQTSLINPPHSATPSCCSRPRPIIQTAQKRHKCFTSGHFDQKAINPNQQEDRN